MWSQPTQMLYVIRGLKLVANRLYNWTNWKLSLKKSSWRGDRAVNLRDQAHIPWHNPRHASPCFHSDRQCNYKNGNFWSAPPIRATQVGCSCRCTHWGTSQRKLWDKIKKNISVFSEVDPKTKIIIYDKRLKTLPLNSTCKCLSLHCIHVSSTLSPLS